MKKNISNFKNFENINTKELKILPHSIESEQSVLGGLMLNNNKWDEIIEYINENDFFNNKNKIIFNEMKYLIDIKQPIDLITISESLEKKNLLNLIGGFSYLAELSKNIPSIKNIVSYLEIIKEKSIIREIILISYEIINLCYNPQKKYSKEILDIVESKIFKLSEKRNIKFNNPKNISLILNNTINKIKEYSSNNNKITGISTGYHDLDEKTLGFQNSDLIIIAARPSMGKTTFAINLCENIILNNNKPVLIFSLEMSEEQIIMKILSSMSRINQINIRTGQLNIDNWNKINNIVNILLNKKNLYIDDSSTITPTELKSKSRKIYKENDGLSLIMIDYLQLIKVSSSFENRTLEIAEISRSLKSLAKELNIPIIALSQLNRSLEQRYDKRPINSDLRESGSIEQDADLIMFIYRDEIYNENSNLKGIAEIIISKQRNGPIGSIKLLFNSKISKFDNYYI
ncbi:replicative DNA helicase [endosymbiont of Pachyrhynchus infernalis]|nr:replicative DNA helicase [endosymbiont of Pachyrhynchus infernalis]BBA84774.1 replicative DNA helicase [endosymbiont of Pachyrhynchus infernalis]